MNTLDCMIDNLYIKSPEHTCCEFKLPIEFNSNKEIEKSLKEDLEIPKLYENLINKDSLLKDKWCNNYCNNKSFLKDTQSHIKNYLGKEYNTEFSKLFVENNLNKHFIDKYQYISIKWFEGVNYSIIGLYLLSLYNISTPLFSLLSPILVLIIPYFMLKWKGFPITFKDYYNILYLQFKSSNFYLFFSQLKTFKFNSIKENSYFILTIGLYIYQIYQNILSCLNFYQNTFFVSNFILSCKKYLYDSNELMNTILKQTENYSTYNGFILQIKDYNSIIVELNNKLGNIELADNIITKLSQLGKILKVFYEIKMVPRYYQAIQYTLYLHDYNKDLLKLKNLLISKKINQCIFNNKSTTMKKMYYMNLIHKKKKSNLLKLDKNIIISGPNASGKTTTLKSILLNCIMSQQFGMGCYKSATINTYDYFYSYLNIPDTSDRDSLFQAEARRCNTILNHIKENKNLRHLCIFDEIYSGTNPSDAVSCSKKYLNELNLYKNNVDYIITTHYTDICEYFKEHSKNIINKKMKIIEKNDNIEYLYKIEPGISYVKGGKYIIKNLK